MFNPENSALLETCDALRSILDSMNACIASIDPADNGSTTALDALAQARNAIAEELGKVGGITRATSTKVGGITRA